jgi:hypothetical protein
VTSLARPSTAAERQPGAAERERPRSAAASFTADRKIDRRGGARSAQLFAPVRGAHPAPAAGSFVGLSPVGRRQRPAGLACSTRADERGHQSRLSNLSFHIGRPGRTGGRTDGRRRPASRRDADRSHGAEASGGGAKVAPNDNAAALDGDGRRARGDSKLRRLRSEQEMVNLRWDKSPDDAALEHVRRGVD